MKDQGESVLLAESCSSYGLDVSLELSLADRIALAQRLGHPRLECTALGTQDRAAAALRELGALVELSGDANLVVAANEVISRWNAECIALFEHRVPHTDEISLEAGG